MLLWFCAFMYLRFYAFLFFTFSFIFSTLKSELYRALLFLPSIIEQYRKGGLVVIVRAAYYRYMIALQTDVR